MKTPPSPLTAQAVNRQATAYRNLIGQSLGPSYAQRANDFLRLVDLEQQTPPTQVPVAAAIVPVKGLLVKALLKLSQTAEFDSLTVAISRLAERTKRASCSADLVLILDEANALLYPIHTLDH